jgi:hypothetical protein
LQERQGKALKFQKAIRTLQVTKLASAWNSWKAFQLEKAEAKGKLLSAVKLMTHRVLVMTMIAWRVIPLQSI